MQWRAAKTDENTDAAAGSEVTCRGGNVLGGGGRGEILMDGEGTIPDLEGLHDVGTCQ